MFPVVPGGERQREMAYRTGVNIVMYALTGNYKADQVHIPALARTARPIAHADGTPGNQLTSESIGNVVQLVASISHRCCRCPSTGARSRVAAVLVAMLLIRRSRGALLRALALAAVIFALANPTLRQEERENLGNIAIVVVDESTSPKRSATRPEQAAAIRKDLEAKLGRIENLEIKWITSSRPSDSGSAGTNVFADLNRALADTPPDRLAGVIVITDGQIHDVPKSGQRSRLRSARPRPPDRPSRTSSTAASN